MAITRKRGRIYTALSVAITPMCRAPKNYQFFNEIYNLRYFEQMGMLTRSYFIN